MKTTSTLFLFIILLINTTNCRSQRNTSDKVVGGPFENREFFFIGMPEHISAVDTSAGWTQNGPKLLIEGIIYKPDGKTPAPGVILYYYHTDIHGYYADREGLDPRVRRHGYIRGWVQSDENGHYAIYTIRPAPYPNRNDPAHIHPAIKEPGIDVPYYVDEFVFDDDPLLTSAYRQDRENRGGSGILHIKPSGNLQVAQHDIILGLNVPNYPSANDKNITSGRRIGEDIHSFTPYHAWGVDKGTKTCPICKYGFHQGVLYFVGSRPDWDTIGKWLRFLDKEGEKRPDSFNAFFIFGDENQFNKNQRIEMLENLGRKLQLENVALTFVPALDDKPSDVYLNNINPDIKNTFILYHHYKIADTFVNLDPTSANFHTISKRLDEIQSKNITLVKH